MVVSAECPAPERLLELADGSLPDGERSELELHIDSCEGCRMGLAAVVATDAPPKTLGRFRIDGVLGAGGMGVVYRAFDPKLARPVAVKVVRPEMDDAELRSRLEREARALGRVNHPNVCHVYDVGSDRDEVWIAMELVDGTTLRTYLAHKPTRDSVFSILEGAARGLAAAHAAGLVHRDVKPENVLVDRSGRAVVTDFGLARGVDGSTKTSVLAGTPAYMAPEQLDGIAADARTDQYAFAVMAHEALTGQRPKRGSAVSDKLPGPLRAVIARALSDEPNARYPSLPAFIDALLATRSAKKSRVPIVAAIAGVAALGGAAATYAVVATHKDEPPPVVATRAPTAPEIQSPPGSAAPVVAAVPSPPPSPGSAMPIDAGVAPKRVAAAPPPDAGSRKHDAGAPDAARITVADPIQPNSGPRLGQKSAHSYPLQDLDRIEDYMATDCELPSPSAKPSLPGPPMIDWGKVTRGPVDVIATLDTGAERDMRLYEVAGARGTYVFDAHNASLAGQIDAQKGDLVALCPERTESRWQLPADWAGPHFTTVRFAAHVKGPPTLPKLPYVHPHAPPYTTKNQTWSYADRFVTYVRDPRLTSDGKYYNFNWYFEVDGGKQLPKNYRGFIVADHPRFEEREGHPVVILHAAEFHDHLFPR